jgi:hypothetical protein
LKCSGNDHALFDLHLISQFGNGVITDFVLQEVILDSSDRSVQSLLTAEPFATHRELLFDRL